MITATAIMKIHMTWTFLFFAFPQRGDKKKKKKKLRFKKIILNFCAYTTPKAIEEFLSHEYNIKLCCCCCCCSSSSNNNNLPSRLKKKEEKS